MAEAFKKKFGDDLHVTENPAGGLVISCQGECPDLPIDKEWDEIEGEKMITLTREEAEQCLADSGLKPENAG